LVAKIISKVKAGAGVFFHEIGESIHKKVSDVNEKIIGK
jgi:hypothetical protein